MVITHSIPYYSGIGSKFIFSLRSSLWPNNMLCCPLSFLVELSPATCFYIKNLSHMVLQKESNNLVIQTKRCLESD